MAKRSKRSRSGASSRGKSKGGKDKDRDKDKEKRKSRMVRSAGGSNHTPLMIAGGALLLLIAVGVIVKVTNDQRAADRERERQRRAEHQQQEAQQVHDRQMAHYSPTGAPATSPSAPTSSGAAMATRRSAWANARIQVGRDRRSTGDQRYLKAFCGSCNAQLTKRSASCPKCGAKLRWPEKINCEFCAKEPKVELGPGQSKVGFCGVCGGTGKNPDYKPTARLPFGMSADATGKYGEKCPACKGSGRCSHCGGRGRFEVPEYFGN